MNFEIGKGRGGDGIGVAGNGREKVKGEWIRKEGREEMRRKGLKIWIERREGKEREAIGWETKGR